MIGIYKFTNLINNKSYIGQSINVERRYKNHIYRMNGQENSIFHKALKKYGVNNFAFEIIEECSCEELNEKECFYIKKYNTLIPNGYNVDIGGNFLHGVKLTFEQVQKIRFLLKTTNKTNIEIANLFNVSENTISAINTGYRWKEKEIIYPIRKKEKRNKKVILMDPYVNKYLLKRKVDRPSPKKLAIEIINSSFEATGRKFNVSGNTIKNWCRYYEMPHKFNELKEYVKLNFQK